MLTKHREIVEPACIANRKKEKVLVVIENFMEIPQKVKHIICSATKFLGLLYTRSKSRRSSRCLYIAAMFVTAKW